MFLLVQSVLQVLGPLLTKIAVDRYLGPAPTPRPHVPRPAACPPTRGPASAQIGLLYLAVLVGTFVSEFVPDVPDAVHRPARHVRPAPRS